MSQEIDKQDSQTDTPPDTCPPPIDVTRALQLRLQHRMSYRAIADKLGCSKSGVHDALTKLLNIIDDPALTQAYRSCKADVIESVQLKYLVAMADVDKIKAASSNNLAYAASQLDNMIRLDRGQSTSNISIDEINQRLKERQREIEELESQLTQE